MTMTTTTRLTRASVYISDATPTTVTWAYRVEWEDGRKETGPIEPEDNCYQALREVVSGHGGDDEAGVVTFFTADLAARSAAYVWTAAPRRSAQPDRAQFLSAVHASTLPPVAKSVLQDLADRTTGRQGVMGGPWPSYDSMAVRVGCEESDIRAALAVCWAAGWIFVDRVAGVDHYILTISALPAQVST